jgi:hypothetical protein
LKRNDKEKKRIDKINNQYIFIELINGEKYKFKYDYSFYEFLDTTRAYGLKLINDKITTLYLKSLKYKDKPIIKFDAFLDFMLESKRYFEPRIYNGKLVYGCKNPTGKFRVNQLLDKYILHIKTTDCLHIVQSENNDVFIKNKLESIMIKKNYIGRLSDFIVRELT